MAAQASTSGGNTDITMYSTLWSELQNHIDMKHIFAKLPFREFFQLRLVCKDWNRLASDEKFLEESFKDLIPKPYFVVVNDCVHALLTYDASSRRWSRTWLPFLQDRCGHIAMEGLIYTYNRDSISKQQVFNLHTRVLRQLPQPDVESTPTHPYVGMALDRSVSPYAFQIVLGSKMHTQIYNSTTNSWTQRQTEGLDRDYEGRGTTVATTCAHRTGFIYIAVPGYSIDLPNEIYDPMVISYDLERGIWETLELDYAQEHDCEANLGAWQNRVFNVTVLGWLDCITVWEVIDQFNEAHWTVFDRMPKALFNWLAYGEDQLDPDPEFPETSLFVNRVYTSFCSEYVLVYTGLLRYCLPERFVVFNLDTQVWEKVEMALHECLVNV